MQRRAAAGVAAGGVLLVVVCAALEGPARFHPPFTFGGGAAPAQPPVFPSATASTHALPQGAGEPIAGWVVTVVMLLAVAVAVLLILVPLRRLLAQRRARPQPVATPPSVPASGAARDASAAEADPEAVRRGIRAAIESWAGARDPADAVVRAWLALQQTAEDAGLTRAASETPSEFAVRVLARTSSDRGPVRELLALYLAARFGADPVGDAESARARAALEAIEHSWGLRRAGAP